MLDVGKVGSIVISVAKHINRYGKNKTKIDIEQLTLVMKQIIMQSNVNDDEYFTDPELQNRPARAAAKKAPSKYCESDLEENGDSDDESAACGSEYDLSKAAASKQAASKQAASKKAASKQVASTRSIMQKVPSLEYADVMQEMGVTTVGGVTKSASSCDCSMKISGHNWMSATENPKLRDIKHGPWIDRENGLEKILPKVDNSTLSEMQTLKDVTIFARIEGEYTYPSNKKQRLLLVCCDIIDGVHQKSNFERWLNPGWLFLQHQLKIYKVRHNKYCAQKRVNDKGKMVENDDYETGMNKQLLTTVYYNTVNCMAEYGVEVRFMTKLKGKELERMIATNPGASQKTDLVQMTHNEALVFIKKQFTSKLNNLKRKWDGNDDDDRSGKKARKDGNDDDESV